MPSSDPPTPQKPESPQPERQEDDQKTMFRFARPSSRFPILMFVLCFLTGLMVLPFLAEQMQYALTRGYERAKSDAAKELLQDLPDPSRRVPLVVKYVAPSVVGIETEMTEAAPPSPNGDPRSRIPLWRSRGEGSGVIVDEEGYLLTNFHVIENARQIVVRLSDGRRVFNVELVGFDPITDLAVLKIDLSNLSAMPWGDSDALEVGDSVLAIGSPFGLFHTVTSGIISAKERYNALEDGPTFQEFLQTDAAVNPGSSGGPLVDMEGKLVGINTAIYGEAYQGISFSIPSRVAKTVYQQIRETGKVTHGWLGVLPAPLPAKMAKEHGLEDAAGVLIYKVLAGSPAQRAGLEDYDILLKWNDIPIRTPADLTHVALLSSPGTEVTLKIIRDGKPRELQVEVGRRPVRL